MTPIGGGNVKMGYLHNLRNCLPTIRVRNFLPNRVAGPRGECSVVELSGFSESDVAMASSVGGMMKRWMRAANLGVQSRPG